MANPAILAGLLAGYTVGAVVTALAAARDEPLPGPSPVDRARSSHPSAVVACTGALRRTSRHVRCLRASARALSGQRR